ncbi:MAG: type VI secretion system baseplate subunit TssF [Desulfobacterales bacterium]|nr:type VI secretion system baseplate subunit TssF [Desulfobacterales bacterium]
MVADSRRAFAYEVYAIDSVRRVRQTQQGEAITEFRPFFSLAPHGETPERNGHYWYAQRDHLVAETVVPATRRRCPSSMPISTRCSPRPTWLSLHDSPVPIAICRH